MVGLRLECPNYGAQANCGLSADFKWPVESNKLTLSFELRTKAEASPKYMGQSEVRAVSVHYGTGFLVA